MVPMAYNYMKTRKGKKKLHQTTMGWTFHVKWKDGSKSWVSLKHLKETNPVNMAEYMVAHEIDEEPAFTWWVTYTL